MRRIVKGHEPPELIAHRHLGLGATYDNAPKAAMRAALFAEQQGLCAYCMVELPQAAEDVMKIEHFTPQSVTPALALAWPNLLGVCMGGQGKSPRAQTCDTRKGDQTVSLDPTQASIERQVRYETRGRVVATDPDRQGELDAVLGLNVDALVRARESVLDAYLDWMRKEKPVGTWTAADRQAVLAAFRTTRHGRLRGFVGIVEWWVRRRG